jgi:hypothetical protein
LEFYLSDNVNYPELIATGNVTDGEFHNIVAVRDEEDMYIYIDGVLDSNLTGTGLGYFESSYNFVIGTYSYESINSIYNFDGLIDEVAIFSKAFTPEEVSELFAEAPVEEQEEQTSSVQDTALYQVMDSAGAGLGIFIQFMASSLPVLLIVLAMVGIIVIVGLGIAKIIKFKQIK